MSETGKSLHPSERKFLREDATCTDVGDGERNRRPAYCRRETCTPP